MKKIFIAAMFVGASAVPILSHAQITGPAHRDATTVESILKAPKDDQDVVLQGRLLRKTGNDTYVFSDGTGEITVDIDDDDLPQEKIDENILVELRGEVDVEGQRPPQVDVDTVRLIK